MTTECYKFVRDTTSMKGSLSSNRPSTDALNAVSAWLSGATGRSYAVQIDEDDTLVVNLTWSEADRTAGTDLDYSCRSVGVDRSHVQR
jgi:hypothetical protein